MVVVLYHVQQSHLIGQLAQCLALHQLWAGVGQEALALALEVAVNDFAYRCVEHGIAKELKPLVVKRASFLVAVAHTAVHQGQLVVFYLAWPDTGQIVKSWKKLLILAERESNEVENGVHVIGNWKLKIQNWRAVASRTLAERPVHEILQFSIFNFQYC